MRLGVGAALVGGRLLPGDVEIEDGVIIALGVGAGTGELIAVPGFVDLQVNGFAGVDFQVADVEGYRRAGEALLTTGVTAFQPTFITAPEVDLAAALQTMPTAGCGPRIIGAHLEGPFLSPRRLGAHDAEGCRAPDLALLRRLLEAGPVSEMTLAPELHGAFELIDELVGRGVTVSCGHSDATAAEAHLAFDRGAHTVTHLFNAMRPSVPRDPGIAMAALTRSDVTVQVIVDGHHLASETVLVAWQAAAGRFALVTDAVGAAGMADGRYALGGTEVVAEGGVVRRADGTLAGSALTMIQAVRNLHGLGAELEDALAAASTVPARIVGRADLGRLGVGAAADIVVLDDRLEVRRVLVQGGAHVAG
jgi:N-acetylglucosamine-6-phosphate deacetylase